MKNKKQKDEKNKKNNEQKAHDAYCLASNLLFFNSKETCSYQPEDYLDHGTAVTFSKWVMLLNLFLPHYNFVYHIEREY